jgi:hypothetical protein
MDQRTLDSARSSLNISKELARDAQLRMRDILTGRSVVVGQNTVITVAIVILVTATRAFTADRIFTEVEWGFREAALAVAVIVAK